MAWVSIGGRYRTPSENREAATACVAGRLKLHSSWVMEPKAPTGRRPAEGAL